jgi:hypothetical protein
MAALLLAVLLSAAPASDAAKTDKAVIGVRTITLDAALLEQIKLHPPPVKTGVLVAEVIEGGPAEETGIERGDIIYKIDETKIDATEDIVSYVQGLTIGAACEVFCYHLAEHEGKSHVVKPKVKPPSGRNARLAQATSRPATIVPGKASFHWIKQSFTIEVASQAKIAAAAKARETARAEALAKAAQEPPVSFSDVRLGENIIGEVTVYYQVRATRVGVEAFELDLSCYTKFGDPVRDLSGENSKTYIWQDRLAAAGDGATGSCTLHFQGTAGRVTMELKRAKLADGTIWKPSPGHTLKITVER